MNPTERAVLHKILHTLRKSHRIHYASGCRADDQSIVAMEAMHKSMADILDSLLHPCNCECDGYKAYHKHECKRKCKCREDT